jgi:hypothetical protein
VVEVIAISISSLGLIGSLATSPLPQKGTETDKAGRGAADQAREIEAARQAEAAAGIGQTEEDSQASERDADGRRLWEAPAEKGEEHDDEGAPSAEGAATPLSKDPAGEAGGELDLLG